MSVVFRLALNARRWMPWLTSSLLAKDGDPLLAMLLKAFIGRLPSLQDLSAHHASSDHSMSESGAGTGEAFKDGMEAEERERTSSRCSPRAAYGLEAPIVLCSRTDRQSSPSDRSQEGSLRRGMTLTPRAKRGRGEVVSLGFRGSLKRQHSYSCCMHLVALFTIPTKARLAPELPP